MPVPSAIAHVSIDVDESGGFGVVVVRGECRRE